MVVEGAGGFGGRGAGREVLVARRRQGEDGVPPKETRGSPQIFAVVASGSQPPYVVGQCPAAAALPSSCPVHAHSSVTFVECGRMGCHVPGPRTHTTLPLAAWLFLFPVWPSKHKT